MHQEIAADTARPKLTNAGAQTMTARDPIDPRTARTTFQRGFDGGTSRLSVESP
jgi:hypothetical protein